MPSPTHLTPSFGVTPFEFMEKLYGSIDTDKLRIKFLALNVDFDGLSLDFLGSRKPAHEGIKYRYPHKSQYITVVGQSFVKTAGDRLTVCEQELL